MSPEIGASLAQMVNPRPVAITRDQGVTKTHTLHELNHQYRKPYSETSLFVILHCLMSKLRQDCLRRMRWWGVGTPPYSPDLSCFDDHIFGRPKKTLRGTRILFGLWSAEWFVWLVPLAVHKTMRKISSAWWLNGLHVSWLVWIDQIDPCNCLLVHFCWTSLITPDNQGFYPHHRYRQK
jgi:hypothetical protein